MKAALIILLLSLGLLGYSYSLKPYRNAAEFQSRSMQMTAGDSEKYFALREEMLTPKFNLQDYGITGILLAFCAWVAARYKAIASPRHVSAFFIVAVAAPCLFTAAYVFDLFQGASRGEFPPWADSLGIPLTAVPALLGTGLAWSLPHLAMLSNTRRAAVPLHIALSRTSNPWLLFLSLISTALSLACIVTGAYWYAVPFILWLYFFLALGAARRAASGP